MSQEPWQILMGTVLFDRKSPRQVQATWPYYKALWPDPTTYLSHRNRHSPPAFASGTNLAILDNVAEALFKVGLDELPVHLIPPTLSVERQKVVMTVAGKSYNLRPTAATRRLAGRAFGNGNAESHWTAQIGIARLVGLCHARFAYVAVLEIGEQYCRPRDPLCTECPIQSYCVYYQMHDLPSDTASGGVGLSDRQTTTATPRLESNSKFTVLENAARLKSVPN